MSVSRLDDELKRPRAPRWREALAGAVLLALAGCGGGELTAGAQASEARVRPLTAAAPATASAVPIDTAALFDWAQLQLPSLFPPGPTNQALSAGGVDYTVRYYADAGNILGVAGGRVYGYGTFTNFQLLGFGFTADYTCAAAPANCLPATGVALAWDGGKSWDGSDWQ